MIITSSPLRISLGGGGTDLPSYYREYGGFVLSAAINRYVYITLHETFGDDLIIKYSEMERAATIGEVRHPLIRESLRLVGLPAAGLEITSMSDIPAGTGLGSSGSFTTTLLYALHLLNRKGITKRDLAEMACHIEIDILGEPVGKQDQYIAAFGGLMCFEFDSDGSVKVEPVQMSRESLSNLEDNLVLFFTGFSRSASGILSDQDTRSRQKDPGMIDNLHFVKQMGRESRDALESGNLRDFAEIMHTHWEHKKKRSNGMSNSCIDEYYRHGRENGAMGGKLIGAGGGGFLMFYTEDKTRLRRAMLAAGLREVRFRFDHEGTKVVNTVAGMTGMLDVAILAGGLATRLRPVTETIPKSLIEVNGEPFISHQLRLLSSNGFRRVVMCVGYLGGMIEDFVGDGARFGIEVLYSSDGPGLLGTGGAIRNALPLLGDVFFTVYGDSYLRCDYAAVGDYFLRSGKSGLMTVFRNEGRWDSSNVEFRDGRVVAYAKKARTPRMLHIDYGLGVFSRLAFDRVPEGPCDLVAVYQDLAARDELAAFEVGERFYETGSFEGIRELSELLLASGGGLVRGLQAELPIL